MNTCAIDHPITPQRHVEGDLFHQPSLVVIGHVACDHIGASTRLGGAAAYAALAAACMRVPTGVVTVAPAGAKEDLLAPLYADGMLQLACGHVPKPTTFELDYSGPTRRIRLQHKARQLTAIDIPAPFFHAPIAYVAPVMGECGSDIVAALQSQTIIVGAQGWLRAADAQGFLQPALSHEAQHLPRRITAVVFSELDHPQAEQLAQRFASRVRVVALTRGAAGATLYCDGTQHHVEAVPAHEVDPTGAGDVFGIVFGIALHRGSPALEAARIAARAAARVVEGPGLGTLPVLGQNFWSA